jgi:hypothetical protein
MKALIAFFKAIGTTLAIYVTVLVTPALTAVALTGKWSKYTEFMDSDNYVGGMSVLSIIVITVYWVMEEEYRG